MAQRRDHRRARVLPLGPRRVRPSRPGRRLRGQAVARRGSGGHVGGDARRRRRARRDAHVPARRGRRRDVLRPKLVGAARTRRRRQGAFYTLVCIRPRSRGERRSLRTFSPGVRFSPPRVPRWFQSRRASTPTDDATPIDSQWTGTPGRVNFPPPPGGGGWRCTGIVAGGRHTLATAVVVSVEEEAARRAARRSSTSSP
eukprot:30776-Pelagococcus_subviridis.AAC.6